MVFGIHREFEQDPQAVPQEPGEQSSGWLVMFKNGLSVPGAATLAGSFLCFVAALVTAAFANGRAWRADVPLLYSVVLLITALLFGSRAGVIGTVLSALVFATYLFNPLGNLRVASDAARSNLGWMLMIGIAFSFLFAPQKSSLRRE